MPLLANIQIYVPYLALVLESEVRKMTMKRTISGMIGTGSLAHNRRDFIAENVDPDRVQLNICYQNENLKLNKIAARWPAKAVAQFFTFSKKGSDMIGQR